MSAASYAGVRALVLGASGFIGRWVARGLSAQGAEVIGAVRDERSARRVLDEWGVRAELHVQDLADLDGLDALVSRYRPAVVFNLAGYGVDRSEQDPRIADLLNHRLVDALATTLAAARLPAWDGLRLVHAGSAAEYGSRSDDLREDVACRPTTLYGTTKLAGTEALARVRRDSALRATSARISTLYGPGEHEGRLLQSIMKIARSGESLPLTEGRQRRDFAHVEDVAEGMLRLGAVREDVPGIVNLATGRLVTVRWFAETAADVLGVPVDRLQFGALPTRTLEETEHRPINLSLLRALTGWTPGIGLREGFARTAAFRTSPPAAR